MELDGLWLMVKPPPDVTLIFDLLTQKSNQYVSQPRHIFHLMLVNLDWIVRKILYSWSFWVIACCDLDLWPAGFNIESSHLWTQIHLWPKLGKIPFSGFWDVATNQYLNEQSSRKVTCSLGSELFSLLQHTADQSVTGAHKWQLIANVNRVNVPTGLKQN